VDLWVWGAFLTAIAALLAIDLFVVHRDAHEVSLREAARWSAIWVSLGLAFCAVIWWWMGPEAAGSYLAGYLIEKSLSVDNVVVFALIFASFSLPARYQHRVLFWGVLGAIAFRAIFILAGVAFLEAFHWAFYLFGAFLIVTGFRISSHRSVADPGRNPVLRAFRRVVPITEEPVGQRLVVRRSGRWMATPLLAVVVVIETTDIVFAADSIPAVFAVTRDPFLVFTSNVFAILGLRAMYFLLAGVMDRFRYLRLGLAVVLVFVGAKMVASDLVSVPIWLSLGVIAATIGASIALSLRSVPAASSTWQSSGTPMTDHHHRHEVWGDDPEELDASATVAELEATEPAVARRWHDHPAIVPFKAVALFVGRNGRRIGVTIAGIVVLLVGVAGLVLPVLPGWLLIFVGLGILATEYVWAQRLLKLAKEKANAAKDKVLRKNDEQP
jgi:tellurite resistance protein TerC